MSGSPRLHVILVSHNTRELLRRCLHSFEGDLAEGDLAEGDTEVHAGSLRALVDALEGHPTAGIAGPSEVRPGGASPALSAGHQPRLWRLLTHYAGISRLSRDRPGIEGLYLLRGINDDRDREVGWVSGSCMLIRADVAARLGPLTQRWFMYAEDLEYCLRATRAGYSVWHVPGAIITHHVGASSRAGQTTRAARSITNVAWVSSTKQFYRQEWQPARATYLLWRLVLAGGLLSRWAPERMRARRGGAVRRRRADDLLAYAREAWADDWRGA